MTPTICCNFCGGPGHLAAGGHLTLTERGHYCTDKLMCINRMPPARTLRLRPEDYSLVGLTSENELIELQNFYLQLLESEDAAAVSEEAVA